MHESPIKIGFDCYRHIVTQLLLACINLGFAAREFHSSTNSICDSLLIACAICVRSKLVGSVAGKKKALALIEKYTSQKFILWLMPANRWMQAL